MKYKFRYIDKIPSAFISVNLAFGSAIHSSLAWLHEEIVKGNMPTLEEFQQVFSIEWYSQTIEENINYNGCNWTELLEKGKAMLALYHENPAKEIQAIESGFIIPIINPATGEQLDTPLKGIFDLVLSSGTIVEFKTAGKTFDLMLLHKMLQLTAYSYAFEYLYKQKPSNLKLIAFIKNKNPKMEQWETTRNEKDYIQFFNITKNIITGIKNKIFFPIYTYLCKDCEYLEECKKWEGK
ncbi:PD-(D/E)XK nuclease family protein [Candidatus Desantisbacteria bacterium]|nr:PD-(D/E)XK nuclease family protein [Candidatus Desantisbacteria bacterium]